MSKSLMIFSFVIILSSSVYADQSGVREVRSWVDGQWAVVDVKTVTGTVVVLSDVVGREIDFEERSRFAVFEGETLYNRKQKLSVLKTPVTGFQSAVFLKLVDDTYGVKISYKNQLGFQNRLLRIKDAEELNHMRDYLVNFEGANGKSVGYPMDTEEEVSFEVVQPRFQPRSRLMMQLELENGEKVKGEVLPMMEDDQMMIETNSGFRRIMVGQINSLRLSEYSMGGVVKRAVRTGTEWTLLGAALASVAGMWEPGRSVWDEVKVVAPIMGGVGFLGTLVFDLGKVPDREFHLGSLDRTKKRLEISPTQIRLRF